MSEQNKFDPFEIKAFSEAKRKMCLLKTGESMDDFFKVFASIVQSGEWVSAPTNNKQLVTKDFRGGTYLAIYSSLANRLAEDSKDTITTDINKFIDIIYENPCLLGLVVDPNKEPFLINRRAIHELTNRKDPRMIKKDWGVGIPTYDSKDLMVEEELLDFGMQIVEDFYINKHGFTILEKSFGTRCFPNFALQKDGVLYFVKVDVGIVDRPVINQNKKDFFLAACKRFNAKCLYSPIGIVPSDEIRATKKIALYGDAYHIDFAGVEELN